MTSLVVSIVRHWVRLYTAGLEASVRERIRQEIEADLWEQMNSEHACSNPMKVVVAIFL